MRLRPSNPINEKRPKQKNKSKWNAKRRKAELDTLWSIRIRDRDRNCQKCGGIGGLQAAHIFSRGNLTMRWDLKNGIALCYACHIHWGHRRPVEFTLWVIGRLGEDKFAALKKKSQNIYDPSNFQQDFEKIKVEFETGGMLEP